MTTFNAKSEQQKAVTRYLTNLPEDVRKVILKQHFAALKEYARRAVGHGQVLTAEEERDRKFRMSEFLILGRSLNLTEKQLVALLYKGLFDFNADCPCPACREEKGADQQPAE